MICWLSLPQLESRPSRSVQASLDHWWYLADLYSLANKYAILDLKNDIYDDIYDSRHDRRGRIGAPQLDVIKQVYRNSEASSSFRKLVVAWYVSHIKFDLYQHLTIAETLSEIPRFASDLAIALANKSVGKFRDPIRSPKSELHIVKASDHKDNPVGDVQGGGVFIGGREDGTSAT